MGAEQASPPLVLEVVPPAAAPQLRPGASMHVTVPHPGKAGHVTAVHRDGTRARCVVTHDGTGALLVRPE